MAEREWFEKDYYKVLGLSSSATDKEITRAYRKLAKQLHPDTNPGSEERFKEVSVAYDVLGDDAKRKEYDEGRRRLRWRPRPRGVQLHDRRLRRPGRHLRRPLRGAPPARPARGRPRDRLAPGVPRRRGGRDDDGDAAQQRRLPHLRGSRPASAARAAGSSTTTRAPSPCRASARSATVAAGGSSRPVRPVTAPGASPRRDASTCACPPGSSTASASA